MLQILISGTPLVLDPKTKIRYELNTSYFDVDSIRTGVVWHFDIPVAGNEETLNYSNNLHVSQKQLKYDCAIILHAFPIGRGKLIVNSIKHNSFRVMVVLNGFAVDFDGVNLNDVNYTEEQIGGDPHDQANVLQHAADVNSGAVERDYRFPMTYAPVFYGEPSGDDDSPEYNPNYLGFLNFWANGEFAVNSVDYVSDDPYYNRNTMVPFPMVFPVLQKQFAEKGYKLKGSLPEHNELRDLIVFNNNTLDEIDKNYHLKASLSYNLHILSGEANEKLIKFDNKEDNDGVYFDGLYNAPEAGTYQLSYLIGARKSELGTWGPERNLIIRIYKDDQIISERIKMLSNGVPILISESISLNIDSAATFKVTAYWDIETNQDAYLQASSVFECRRISADGINNYKNTLKLQDYIPQISTHTLVNSLRNAFFGALFFNDEEKIVEMELLNDVLANPYSVDLTAYCVDSSEELTPGEEQEYELTWENNEEPADTSDLKVIEGYDLLSQLPAQPKRIYARLNLCNAIYVFEKRDGDTDAQWYYYGHNFRNFNTGNGDETIAPSISVCPMPAAEKWDSTYPYTTLKGNSPLMKDNTDDIGFQLLLWRGVTDRPVAVPVSHIESGKVGDLSLDFNADDGIIANFGSRWIDFVTHSETLTRKLTGIDPVKFLEIQDLFLPRRSGKHPRWVYMHGIRALPRKFTAVIDIEGNITDCEIELVKKV